MNIRQGDSTFLKWEELKDSISVELRHSIGKLNGMHFSVGNQCVLLALLSNTFLKLNQVVLVQEAHLYEAGQTGQGL